MKQRRRVPALTKAELRAQGSEALAAATKPIVKLPTKLVRQCGRCGEFSAVMVEPGEPPQRAIFYAPSTDCDREGIVHRRPQSVFGCIALDFRGVDQEAEVEAFRLAFKPELETLADEIGKPPTFRWGVVYAYG